MFQDNFSNDDELKVRIQSLSCCQSQGNFGIQIDAGFQRFATRRAADVCGKTFEQLAGFYAEGSFKEEWVDVLPIDVTS